MKFIDFSPPASPSLEQQRDALKKGLGRALKWADAGIPGTQTLLAACLTDQRFDTHIEDSRSDWLWQMIEILDVKDRFRVPILHGLYELDDRSAFQLVGLGFHFARTGDETFRSLLYEIVESKPIADSPMLGESELLKLDGGDAFIFAVRLRGQDLAGREWDWDDGYLVHEALELLGKDQVHNRLNNTHDEAVRRFCDCWNRETEKKVKAKQISRKERLQSISVEAIFSEAGKENSSMANFRGWGMLASEADLHT